MSRHTLAAAVLSLCLSTSLSAGFTQQQDFRPASPAELALNGVDYAPGAPAAVLDWVRFDDDLNSVSSEYVRIKIFSEEGKKYADVEVPYISGYPVNGRVTDIAARTIQPDGSIVPFDGKVYDKVLFKSGGVRVRAKTFSLAGVRPGSILEYRFQHRWNDTMLFPTTWKLQRDIPVLRARLTLQPYSGEFASYFTYFNLPKDRIPVKGPRGYEMELSNVPVLVSEPLAPPEAELTSRVNFYYTTSRVRPEQFWDEQTKVWTKEIEGFIGNPLKLRQMVQPLLGKDPLETAKNLYAKVQTLRNLSFEDEPTAKAKKNPDDVLAKGEGYRGEINRTFVALARAAGLEAYVIRIAPRDERFFSRQIPDSEQMSAEIAAVTIEGKPLYLDPGTPTAPFGTVSWEKSTVPGFRLVKGQPAELLTVADQKSDDAVTRRSADLQLADDRLEGRVIVTWKGQEALKRRLRTWGEAEAERTKAFEDEAKGWFPGGATVKLLELTGAEQAGDLVAKFDVSIPGLVSAAGSRTILPMAVFTANAPNPFAAATRTHPIYYPHQSIEHDEVKVRLPETLAPAALPAPARFDVGSLSYSNQMKHNGQELLYERSMKVATMIVDAKHYGALRNFYNVVATADRKPLVLVSK